MTVFAWSAAVTSRVREQLAGWRARHADLEQWNSAQTLAELGQVTARWLRGELYYNWAYNGRPDEETDQIAAPLAAVNQAGYVTTGSQPGLQEGVWSQRAAVEGLADDATRDRLQAIAERHGLRFQAHKAGWRMDYSTAVNVTKTTDPEGNVWEHTGFGSTISRNHLCNLLLGHCPDVHDEACDAWQVTIIDPGVGAQRTVCCRAGRVQLAAGPREARTGSHTATSTSNAARPTIGNTIRERYDTRPTHTVHGHRHGAHPGQSPAGDS